MYKFCIHTYLYKLHTHLRISLQFTLTFTDTSFLPILSLIRSSLRVSQLTWEKYDTFLNSFYAEVKRHIRILEQIKHKISRNEEYVLFDQIYIYIYTRKFQDSLRKKNIGENFCCDNLLPLFILYFGRLDSLTLEKENSKFRPYVISYPWGGVG